MIPSNSSTLIFLVIDVFSTASSTVLVAHLIASLYEKAGLFRNSIQRCKLPSPKMRSYSLQTSYNHPKSLIVVYLFFILPSIALLIAKMKI